MAEFDAEAKILIVEDEALFAKAISKRLQREAYRCEIAANLEQARAYQGDFAPDMVLLDMRLPDGSGLDFLTWLREQQGSEIPVLIMSAYGELEDAVTAMKLRASDYLKKPVDLDEILIHVAKLMDKQALDRKLQYSRERERHTVEGVQLLGEDPKIRALREQVKRIGSLGAGADMMPPTVLILGETGTGKDVAARLLHAVSARHDKPFVQVDCASLPKDLIEAELFGHEKGAFTNAHAARTGLFEAAEDGALFLDEVGELPLELQAKLLATLERRTIRRIGSTRERPVKAWLIAATNRDLEAMSQAGEFRSDLYFRLNVLTLSMPPLRERGNDIELLARHFIMQTAARYGIQAPQLDNEAIAAMKRYHWPGNVREMKHLIERAVLLCGDGVLGPDSLMLPGAATSGGGISLEGMTLDGAEQFLIQNALERTGGNVSEAARILGVTRMAMRYRMKKYNL